MIDLHTHILNNIDDGPASLEESLALARLYEAAGFSRVVATPHWIYGTAWMPKSDDILRRVERLNQSLQNRGIGIRVFPGMEIAMDGEIPGLLSNGDLLPLGGSNYVLIETPFQMLPSGWEHLFFTITSKGYRILLAHPERCAQIIEDPGLADEMIGAGVYFQSNYDSFLGNNGDEILKAAFRLLKKGYIYCLATDSHDAVHRHPGNAVRAIQALEKKFDEDTLKLLTRINPDRLINGLSLVKPEPAKVSASAKGGRRWWLF